MSKILFSSYRDKEEKIVAHTQQVRYTFLSFVRGCLPLITY